VGTGVGAAIILDGEVYRGSHNAAGEIGHVTLDPDGEPCSCGNRGCVETYLSGPWLARRYRAARPDSTGGATILGETVSQRAADGAPAALAVMAGAGTALGVAVGTMAMVLDVELYVVGGSVAKAGELLLGPAREMMPHCCYESVGSRVQIVGSALVDDGPILGCGWLARTALSVRTR